MGRRLKEPETPKWNVAIAWLKAEPFWQGVAASTFSTGVMAFAGLIAALITGWIDLKTALVALMSFVLVIFGTAAVLVLTPPFKFLAELRKDLDKQAVVPSVGMLGLVAGIAGIALVIVQLLVPGHRP